MSAQLALLCTALLFCLGCFTKNNDSNSMSLSKAIKKSAKSFIRSVVKHKKSQATCKYQNNKKINNFNGSLTIDIINGSVEIIGTKQKECSINEHIFSYKKSPKKEITFIKNDEIYIHNDDNDYMTDYIITVPCNTKVDLVTTNGACKITNITQNILVKAINGSIKLSNITGTSQAETVNGSINSSIAVQKFIRADYSTVNGSIKVMIPSTHNLSLTAHTTHGSIATNFNSNVTQNFFSSSLHQSFDKGSNQLSCSTVNGSINIKQQA